MIRRDLIKGVLAVPALRAGGERPAAAPAFPQSPGLTKSVAEFIVNTSSADIPDVVLELGKKSILDGFGLALAGSVSVLAPLLRRYVEALGSCAQSASIPSSPMPKTASMDC